MTSLVATSRPDFRAVLAGAASCALLLATPGTASAEWTVGASASVAAPLTTEDFTESSTGFAIDVDGGYRIPLGVVALRPELVAGYVGMARSILRARAGVRLEMRGLAAPYVFARAGAADVLYDTTARYGTPASPPVESSEQAGAFAYDVGVGLLVAPRTPAARFELDVHAAFNGVRSTSMLSPAPSPDATWLTAGVGVTAHF